MASWLSGDKCTFLFVLLVALVAILLLWVLFPTPNDDGTQIADWDCCLEVEASGDNDDDWWSQRSRQTGMEWTKSERGWAGDDNVKFV